jgi:phage FluMu gp28-like protein
MSWYPATKLNKREINYLKLLQQSFKVMNAEKTWVNYKLQPHQIKWHKNDVVCQRYNAKNRIVVKSRNTSFTTSCLISNLAAVKYFPGQVVPFVRLNINRAIDLISECKELINNMNAVKKNGEYVFFNPDDVEMKSMGNIKFPNGVEFRAFPANSQSAEVIRGLRIVGSAGIVDECLPPDVRIQTKNGLVHICSINKNSEIKTYNIKTKQIEYKKPIAIIKRELKQRELIYLSLQKNSYSIKCTPNHPLYDEHFNIIQAKDINVGDKLICFNNKNSNTLSQIQKEILYGLLLGDGHLALAPKYKKSAHLEITHSIKQKEYQQHLKEIFDCRETKYIKTSYGGEVNQILTKNNKELLEIYNEIYKDKKEITNNYLNKLTDASLAYWFMDDGSNCDRNIHLATHSFSYNENFLIQQWFKNKYNLFPQIITESRKKQPLHYLTFNRDDSRRFIKIISRYIIPSMRYKLKKFNDSDEYNKIIIDKNNYKICIVQDKKVVNRRCRVYNLEIEDTHNYMIEGMGSLSHNCNFMKDFKDIYIALRDASSGSVDGKKIFQMNIGTTLKGRNTPFNEWFTDIESKKLGNVDIYKWPVFNPLKFNSSLSIYEQDVEPIVYWHTLDDLENKRVEDINRFKEEYMCEVVDSDEQFYSYDATLKCVDSNLVNYTNPNNVNGKFFVGIDVASVNDYFVITIFEKVGDEFIQRYLFYTRDVELDDMQKLCEDIITAWKPLRVVIDSHGIGLQIAQSLLKKFGSIIHATSKINIKGLRKGEIVKFNEFIHTNQKTLMIYNNVKLLSDELQMMHYSSWNYDFKADSSSKWGHGDIAIANAYALLPWNYRVFKGGGGLVTNLGKSCKSVEGLKVPEVNW